MAAHRPDQAGTGVADVMISTPEAQVIPRPGRYEIDTSCSAITFRTRHLFGLAPVRGSFTIRAGTIDVAEPLADSSVHVHIDPASFRTRNGQRDGNVRSERLLDADRYPVITVVLAQPAERVLYLPLPASAPRGALPASRGGVTDPAGGTRPYLVAAKGSGSVPGPC